MKTFITALVSCSLMLGAVVMAQQTEEQEKGKKKKSQETSQTQGQAQGQTQAQPRSTSATGGAQAGAKHGKAMGRHEENAPSTGNAPAANENANASATQERGKHKGRTGTHAERTNSPAGTENTNAAANEGAGKNKGKHGAHNEAAMKAASPNPAATAGTAAAGGAAAGKANKPGTVGKNGKTVNVQQVKAQHANFRAQPKPQVVKSVTYNQNYRIVEAQNWQGPQYEVFRSYTPAWHDAGWYQSNFGRVENIAGGYYYFNNGYWYPAWGYDPGAQYYAYDGPIYVGHAAEPPDRVIANVQAELKDMGYYTGEVDGLLGPMTREALTAYQADHGLYTTAAIDEPTLDAMGLS